MSKFAIGMYVRCPIDYEDDQNPRMFAMGQIIKIDETYSMVTVKFHKIIGDETTNLIYSHVPDQKEFLENKVTKCTLLEDSKVILCDFTIGEIISKSNKREELYSYYVKSNNGQVREVSEEDMICNYTRGEISPILQLINYEFHNPFWYVKRLIPSKSMHIIKNFANGFDTLIGSRAYLLKHQVDTIVRAICEEPCRFMLADEVGLGKTIEACVIMNGLQKKHTNFRTLIVAPMSLCRQWKNELELKFWLESKIIDGENILDYIDGISKKEIGILPLEEIGNPLYSRILDCEWELCIVDETHRLSKMDKEYSKIIKLSKEINNILLLTATPIQERKDEFLNLLKLLNPKKYGEMDGRTFLELHRKASEIRSTISQIYGDLEEFDEDVAEDVLDELEEISEILEDKIVDKLINKIDINSEDNGLEAIKLVIAYISENYQIEKNIIRHRREEIKDQVPHRELEAIGYNMSGSNYNYYEKDTYDALIEYIINIQENSSNIGEYVKNLLSAMFSSPWALETIIKSRLEYLTVGNIKKYKEMRIVSTQAITNVKEVLNEKNILEELIACLKMWKIAAESEIKNKEILFEDPELINGRLLYMVDYIDQEYDDTKFVIFSSWIESIYRIKSILADKYGHDSVATFYTGMDGEELEKNVFEFQNNSQCRFMICDELGGEGRNFQIADKVIHYDMPFSPIDLEQRIGRLDRIGRDRDKPVESIVMYAEETVEEELFNLWNEGLNVFKESLSGMEIVLQDIKEEINDAMNRNLADGFSSTLENIKKNSSKMKKIVAKERYFDLARHMDRADEARINKVIEQFDSENGKLMGKTMRSWAGASGLNSKYNEKNKDIVSYDKENISIKSLKNTLFMIPNMDKINIRNKNIGKEFSGTFSRNTAVQNESLVFFAPGETVFDSIMKNAQEGYRGRCTAIKLNKSDVQWKGFVFKWNVRFNMKELIDKGIDIIEVTKAQGYLPINQITSIVKIDGNDEIGEDFIEKLESEVDFKKAIHIGSRNPPKYIDQRIGGEDEPNLNAFKRFNPVRSWREDVKVAFEGAKNDAFKKLTNIIDKRKIENDFDIILSGKRASNIFFNKDELEIKKCEDLEKILEAVKSGIVNPKLELDSVIHLWMER